jgi:hypothetical protein
MLVDELVRAAPFAWRMAPSRLRRGDSARMARPAFQFAGITFASFLLASRS